MARGGRFWARRDDSSEDESEREEDKEKFSKEGEEKEKDASFIEESAEPEEPTSAIFQPYDPPKLKEGCDHPDPVVETAILARVDPPDITYKHHLKKQMLQGALSRLQLESIVYAMQTFDGPRLISGQRHGYFLGDGAGVGKGRQIAGLIAENWHRGATRALWVSVSMDLKFDAERDLSDLEVELDLWPKGRSFPTGDRLPYGDGVLFCTYTLLVQDKRISQITKWLKADPSGSPLIIFDESHKAKNFDFGAGKPHSKTAINVVGLQEKMPDALVVYCSATGASEPRNLGYMTRLGAWGFESYSHFVGTLAKGGMGAMEMFAVTLKSVGSYSCRSLSYAGAEFEVCQIKIPDDFTIQYERAASFWQLLLKIRRILGDNGVIHNGKRRGGMWGSHLRFFKQMLMASKVPSLAVMVQEAVEKGMSVIIGLQSTGESFLADSKEDDDEDADGMMSAPRMVLQKVITNELAPLLLDSHVTNISCESDVIALVNAWVQKNPPSHVRCRSVPIRRRVPAASEETDVQVLTEMNSEEVESAKLIKAKASGSYVDLDDKLPSEVGRRRLSRITRKRGEIEALVCLSDDDDEDTKVLGVKSKVGKSLTKNPVVQKEGKGENDEDSDCELFDSEFFSWGASGKITPKQEKTNNVSKPLEVSSSCLNSPDGKALQSLTCQGRKRIKFEAPGNVTFDFSTEDLKKSPLKASPPQSKRVRKTRNLVKDTEKTSESSEDGVSTKGTRGKRGRGGREIDPSFKEKKAAAAESKRDKRYDSEKKTRQIDRICKSLLMAIGNLELPFNPLDDLKALLGGEKYVAEMTGRKEEMVKDSNGRVTVKRRCGGVALKAINTEEQKNFMNGKKYIAIISEAASCGISLQADRRVPNQRRRLHITLELPWSADKAVQQFGRSHRSNQVSAPLYRILMANCGGEKRFASSAAKRLEGLGALLRGDRRAVGAGAELKEFNVDNVYGKRALRQMVLDIIDSTCTFGIPLPPCPNNENFYSYARTLMQASGFIDGIPSQSTLEGLKVTQFLNRLLGLAFLEQELLFNYFSQYYDHTVKKYKSMGQYDEGIVTLKGQSVRMLPGFPQVIYKDPIYLKEAKLARLEVDRGIGWERIKQSWDEYRNETYATSDPENGFWITREHDFHQPSNVPPRVLLATAIHGDTAYYSLFREFRVQTPNLNGNQRLKLANMEETWKKTTIQEAEKCWRYWYERTEHHCLHGPGCNRNHCQTGTRMVNHDLIIGHPLSVFKHLWEVRQEQKSRNDNEKVSLLRIVKAELNDGSRLLGIKVSPSEIQPLLDRIGLP